MKNIVIIVIAVIVFIFATATYTVDQRETAIKFRFKEIVETDIKPGLHFKIPFVNTVEKFSKLILTLDAQPDRFLTGEKKYVQVDFFVKWRIADAGVFYRATRGDLNRAQNRLESIMKDGLRNEFSTRTVKEAITGERGEIMTELREKAAESAKSLGIEIVDTRVSQIDFPESVSESVYERMRSERQRVAQDFRSRGKAEGEKLRAIADRQAVIIEANAYRDAEKIRGNGDAKSAEIYAKAYQRNPEFYAFYRSLGAYKKSLGNGGDIMVIEPDAEFFKYFKQQGGQ
ncbi:protease modulator HflC [Cocleimonas flava]|uniref:Protein HflC n=1 Tax=Cocleimonas flava TaxID=634765 RepID=A0A4R1F4D0_9GAMM|nr:MULTISPECIES: protease modulator HflC [Cocleimonas]MEB8433644.1 protease modulator HflC [Cocleimonas sp. KMM 6892]MEC4716455.1 protease modulator HflC [Cocleimonas sp. KMM 6895]MEC4745652.1 protease modulator HflC [Cocleimonas sp. KMM 6896]TCJ85291.1 protease FtsH subunit HflC [Cocleimonas flava]